MFNTCTCTHIDSSWSSVHVSVDDTRFVVLPKLMLNLCIHFAQISRAGPECSVFDKQRVNERGAMDSLCHNHTQEGWQLHHGMSVYS